MNFTIIVICFIFVQPGRVAQSVGHLTRESEVLDRYPVWPHNFVSPSADSRRAVVSYWQKYVHEELVNHLGDLSLPRKSVVRLTDRPDMTLDVYRAKTTTYITTTIILYKAIFSYFIGKINILRGNRNFQFTAIQS